VISEFFTLIVWVLFIRLQCWFLVSYHLLLIHQNIPMWLDALVNTEAHALHVCSSIKLNLDLSKIHMNVLL